MIWDTILSVAFLLQIIRISVPYAFAALGGMFSERGGIINIALEGIMLTGAFCAVLGSYLTGSPILGLLCGVLGGMAMSAIHGLMTIRFKTDHIVSGVAINLLAVGVTKFFLKMVFDSSSNSPSVEAIGPLVSAEGGRSMLASVLTHPLVWLAALLIPCTYYFLFYSRFGLRLRACGEHPLAAATLGVNVHRVKHMGVLLSGVLAGLGGIWLAFDQQQFTDNMTNGRGYIALAAMIFGKWHPIYAAGACLLFGFAEALQMALQSHGGGVPSQFVQMLPYVLTIVTLIGFMGRARPPQAIGKPF